MEIILYCPRFQILLKKLKKHFLLLNFSTRDHQEKKKKKLQLARLKEFKGSSLRNINMKNIHFPALASDLMCKDRNEQV